MKIKTLSYFVILLSVVCVIINIAYFFISWNIYNLLVAVLLIDSIIYVNTISNLCNEIEDLKNENENLNKILDDVKNCKDQL